MSQPSLDMNLSRRERQLLDALYRLGKGTANEIRAAVSNPPSTTAVRTHLTNLEAKGFVRFEDDGIRYTYEPVVPREQMAEAIIGDVVETFFDNCLERVVSTLLSRRETKVSQEQLTRIAEIVEAARKEGR